MNLVSPECLNLFCPLPGTIRIWWGSCSNPSSRPHGLRHDTWANGPKDGDTTPWQILDVHLFRRLSSPLIWFWHETCYHWKLYEISLPIIWRTSQMESVWVRGDRCKLDQSCSLNPAPKTCWPGSLSIFGPKVTWMPSGGRGEHLDLVPNQPLWSSMPSMCV
jgi:hypothetical protein